MGLVVGRLKEVLNDGKERIPKKGLASLALVVRETKIGDAELVDLLRAKGE